jgi:heat shock protein HslJ
MVRLVLLLPLTLAACADRPVSLPTLASRSVVEDIRPAAMHDLQGRWTITAVNGRQATGLWVELGGEGLGTVTSTESGIFVGSPQPRTRAYLGCNDWRPNGWTRKGDKLTLGTEMSSRTERGCDRASMALDEEAYAILRKTMTMEFTPPNRLRLINENGTLELVRTLTERAATAFIEQNVRAGAPLSDAMNLLVRGGFACRRLGRHEYGPTGSDGLGPKEIKMVMCYVAVERTAHGYQLVYASLSANQQERLVSVYAGSYPVTYRNVRVDSRGRVTVVRDPSQ